MSSSGECELDSNGESPKVVDPRRVVVYTRKKSANSMHRKTSADNGVKTTETADAKRVSEIDEKYLSPTHHHHHQHHKPHYHPPHNRAHHSSHVSSSANLRKHVLSRRSPSPTATMSPGYEQYQMALLEVPLPRDYGDASSDDLSSEWDSDAPDSRYSTLSPNNSKVVLIVGINLV